MNCKRSHAPTVRRDAAASRKLVNSRGIDQNTSGIQELTAEPGGGEMLTRLFVFGLAIIVCLLAFGVTPATAAPGGESDKAVTFYKDVLPILQQNCQSCHRPGQIGPFSMLTYKELRPWAKAIKAAVIEK